MFLFAEIIWSVYVFWWLSYDKKSNDKNDKSSLFVSSARHSLVKLNLLIVETR